MLDIVKVLHFVTLILIFQVLLLSGDFELGAHVL
jgi:hypothetical protein